MEREVVNNLIIFLKLVGEVIKRNESYVREY